MNSRTLIIQLARFGDLLQTKRLVKSLQTHSQVHLALDSSLAGLAGLIYPQAVVHPLEAHAKQGQTPEEIFSANTRAIKDVAAHNFDLVVNLNFSGLNFSLARIFDPSLVRGYYSQNGQDLRHPWTRLFFRLAAHRRLSPLNLADFWGHFAPQPIPPSEVNPPASSAGQGMGVVLAGRDIRRSVPLPTLAGLIKALKPGLDSKGIVLLGSKSEMNAARQLVSALPPALAKEVQDLTGKTTLAELADTVSSLEAVLTPDTGTMHLSAHLGVRVVAFFISSAFCYETGPYGDGHTVFQAMPACAPCAESRKCNFELVCHDILKTKETFRALCKKDAQISDNALILESFTDDLGVDYLPVKGNDELAHRRKALRELVRRHLGLEPADTPIPQEMSNIFFHEREWMLE